MSRLSRLDLIAFQSLLDLLGVCTRTGAGIVAVAGAVPAGPGLK